MVAAIGPDLFGAVDRVTCKPQHAGVPATTGLTACVDALRCYPQAGTDLAVADLAEEAERRLGMPILPINTATYWLALRLADCAALNATRANFTRVQASWLPPSAPASPQP